jgi:chromosome segregation ATPase
MIKKVIDIEVNTGEAVKDTKDLTNSFVGLDESIQDTTTSVDDLGKEASTSLNSVGKNAAKAERGTKGLARGFKGVGVAIKAAGIGLVIAAVGTLYELLSRNQKVVDAFSTAFETVSILFNEVFDAISNVITKVSESTNGFEALKKTLGGLITLALTPLKLAFFGIVLAVKEAQLAWEQSFLGDKDPETIKRLNAEIEQTKDNIIDVGKSAVQAGKDVVNNIVPAITSVSEVVTSSIDGIKKINVEAAAAQAKLNVELRNTAQIAEANQQRLLEQFDRQAERLRQIRDDDLLSLEERTAANEKLAEVLNEQEKAMIALADLQVAAAQADVNRENSIENQVALINAQAEREGVLAQIEGFRSEQLANRNALIREGQALEDEAAKAAEEVAKTQIELDKKVQASKVQLASQSLALLSGALGKESAAGKAAAVAQATIDTYAGATATYKSLAGLGPAGPALGVAGAALAVTAGLLNVKKILSVKTPGGSGGSAGASVSAPSIPQVQAPRFNVTGENQGNQIAEALASQPPIKAFVVGSEVTTQQALDRAIVNESGI